jgi:hypothetical protein
MSELKVLNPVAKSAGYQFRLADRPEDLKGLTLGLVWNGKHGGNLAMQRVKENIEKKLGYKLKTIEMKDDFPFAPFFIEKVAATCQAVIGATGD